MHFDPSKTYLIGMIEDTNHGRQLQSMYEIFGREHPMAPCDRWTHLATLVNYDGLWKIIITDYPAGCVEVPIEEWIPSLQGIRRIDAIEHPMIVSRLRECVGMPYPVKLRRSIIVDPFGHHERDEEGLMCTEMISAADGGVLPNPLITHPAHYQTYAIAHNIPIVTIYERNSNVWGK